MFKNGYAPHKTTLFNLKENLLQNNLNSLNFQFKNAIQMQTPQEDVLQVLNYQII